MTIEATPITDEAIPAEGEPVGRLAQDLAYLASMPPMPTVAELVAPFARGLWMLHELGGRAESLVFPVEFGGTAEGRAVVDLVRRAIDEISMLARQCVPQAVDQREVFEAMRLVLERIVDAGDLVSALTPNVWDAALGQVVG